MKPLNWICNREANNYMLMRKAQNIVMSANNPNEKWMANLLRSTGHKWGKQAIWGKRLFDFWNPFLGVAVEVDGKEHVPEYDAYRDEYNFRRSGIVVLRVFNKDESQAQIAINLIGKIGTWKDRRQLLGVAGGPKKERRKLVVQSYPPSLLQQYLNKFRH